MLDKPRWQLFLNCFDYVIVDGGISPPRNGCLAVQGSEVVFVTVNWCEGLTDWKIEIGEPELFMLNDPASTGRFAVQNGPFATQSRSARAPASPSMARRLAGRSNSLAISASPCRFVELPTSSIEGTCQPFTTPL